MSELQALAIETARRHGVDPDLFLKLVQAESAWNPQARSPVGAMGLAQLMPGTASDMGVADPWDPAQNLDGGARYLAQQLKAFGDPKLALAAYNAGPGNVRKHGGVPPFAETQNYVQKILGGGGGMSAARGAPPSLQGMYEDTGRPTMTPFLPQTDPVAALAAVMPRMPRQAATQDDRQAEERRRREALFAGLPSLYR